MLEGAATSENEIIMLTRVVGTVDGAVLSAGIAIRAKGGVPGVTIEAVGESTNVVGPTPVRVEHNRGRLAGAAIASSASAGLPVDLGVSLSLRRTDLLSADGAQEGERSEGERPVHLVCCLSRDFVG
jgi:hypothetical protein